MKKEYLIEKSKALFDLAYKMHLDGYYDNAIVIYYQSIDIHPTPEAYTFIGWALSSKGDYENAIEECKKAIELDADFGNPYNDIGAYLIQLNRYEEAICWLNLAITAKNYSNREFAYMNLGIVYEKLGLWYEAIAQYKKSYEFNSTNELPKNKYLKLQALLN